MNCVILKGNTGQDPRIHTFESGHKVAQVSLATTRRGYTKQDGSKVEPRTEWHELVINGDGLVGVVEKFVKKGTPLLVRGELRYRKWTDSEGKERTVAEVWIDDLELCGGEKKEGRGVPVPGEEDLPF